MYPKKLEDRFAKLGIAIGDKIAVEKNRSKYEGLLMPRATDRETIVIKLDNGYNVGIDFEGSEIKLVEKAKPRPKEIPCNESGGEIAILGCGGTISSKVEYTTGAVYPALSPCELKKAFPELERISSIKAKQIFALLSEDMNSEHWKIAAETIQEEIKDGTNGVVVMHGTDTMTYTSAATSFMLQNLPVPVIFVGAQRSSDRPSSENEMNLLNAVYAAKSDIAEVGVCMHATSNDDYCFVHRGVSARKMHTSRRDAFQTVNDEPLAMVDYRNRVFKPIAGYVKRDAKRKLKSDLRINDNVAMIYVHPNIRPSLIASLSDYDGVVLIGTGLGHVPTDPFKDKNAKPILHEVEQLIKSGIPVAMSSQTIFGRLNFNIYTAGRLLGEIGVIGNGADWSPETAFVKLSWILGHEKDPKKVAKEMMTNMVGEISKRSPLQRGLLHEEGVEGAGKR
jgi:glutamyl-tRNA(Gln) amidotransferase subunit D